MRRWGTIAAPAGFVLLLLLVVTSWTPLLALDRDVADGLNDLTAPHPALVGLWKIVSTVGTPLTFQLLTAAASIALWLRGRPQSALFTAVTVLPASLLANAVKLLVDRDRPTVPHPVAHAHASSFPSSHALVSLVGVTVLMLVVLPRVHPRRRSAVVGAGVLVVVLVGFSRLALGVHYVSDVIAGWLLGTTWVLLTRRLVLTSRRPREQLPAAPGRPRETPAG